MHTRITLRIDIFSVAAIVPVLVCGCTPADRCATASDGDRVYMFPGIEGNRWSLSWAYVGLRDGGVQAEIRVFDWDRPIGGLANLTDYEGNRQRAWRVAEEIAEYQAGHKQAPIDLGVTRLPLCGGSPMLTHDS